MTVVYTMVPIEGIVEAGHRPVPMAVAKAKLETIITSDLLPRRVITSYTLIEDRQFKYPSDTPDLLKTTWFFDGLDLNTIKTELEYLYRESVREHQETVAETTKACKTASDEELLELYGKYHYSTARQREDYTQALKNLEDNWDTWDKVKDDLLGSGYARRRYEISRALKDIESIYGRCFFEDINKLKEYLTVIDIGRDEVVSRVISMCHDWCRRNTSHFENQCGDAAFYGAGYWVARLVKNEEWEQREWDKNDISLEDSLTQWNLPFFIVPVKQTVASAA
ncbi:MAG: hypothetical protein JSS66_07290 [Armatimonadetes bacterium]|nr:hypothetical protein [Armatimonadota bacterium]